VTPAASDEALGTPFDIEEVFPDGGPAARQPGPRDPRMPRRRSGSSPQELAVTLVADYTLLRGAWLPSAALVRLLGESGVTEVGARTVISRLSRRGLLEGRRDGRRSLYRIPPPVAAELVAGGRWIGSFAAEPDPWDGVWTVIAFSFSNEATQHRRKLRGRLRWLGFAPLYDGLWISPRRPDAHAESQLRSHAAGTMTVFRAQHLDLGSSSHRDPLSAWDLDLIAGQYREFLDAWSPVCESVRRGEVRGGDAVRARTGVMNTYRRLPLLDPRLPRELLPEDWARDRARTVFVAVYDGLIPAAQHHVRQVSLECGAGTDAEAVLAHSVDQMASGLNFGRSE
jgi:phenylacetic acid degradation operon negative regulatory protein